MSRTIRVSAVVMRDESGRVLNVRKRGTSMLMLPGGKPEAGEDPRDTAVREFAEELGVELDPLLLRGIGRFTTAAANEPGHSLVADVFEHPFRAVDAPRAEIEHLEWVDPSAARGSMAPLNSEHVFPGLIDRAPLARLAPQRIAVYTGSAMGGDPRFARAAEEFGAVLAARGIDLVYGGGKVGLMGVVADAVLAGGGEAFGVIPQRLVDGEIGHAGLTRLEVVPDMHARKRRMIALADALVALPGGPGTLEEFFEAFTWMNLGLHNRPVALVDVDGYWQPMLTALGDMVERGFLAQRYLDSLIVESDPEALLRRLSEWTPPPAKWG
ncbi:MULTISPECIES: TIGR00730 family Rossman fold protein [unclassified Leucobacter]|uniref:TIGR00730 family Rossman fold protein n=1 Tax=unclassified Leucobacter TaxID=2621730 RepID=UPI0012E00755